MNVSTFVENWFSIDFLFISEKNSPFSSFGFIITIEIISWPNLYVHYRMMILPKFLAKFFLRMINFSMIWGDNEHCLTSKVQKENTKKEHEIYEPWWIFNSPLRNPLMLKIMIWKNLIANTISSREVPAFYTKWLLRGFFKIKNAINLPCKNVFPFLWTNLNAFYRRMVKKCLVKIAEIVFKKNKIIWKVYDDVHIW